VGAVSAACLARDGHTVVGVDPNPSKVDMIRSGTSPVVEPRLTELMADQVAAGNLSALTEPAEAVAATDMALVCVGTPSRPNGDMDTGYLEKVSRQIGEAIALRDDFYVVAVRSTSFPGTTARMAGLIAEASGKEPGVDFGVCFNPEFLREGTALMDYYNPPRVVVGGTDDRSVAMVADVYGHIDAPLVTTDLEHAEMVKYLDNAWHALKVGFANEVGRLGKSLGLDARRLMDAFSLDTKLNISPKYLKPGFAFGGSCLPKDLRALTYQAKQRDIDLPILRSVLPSNETHIEWAIDMIKATGSKRIGFLGLSFKPDTDDLRESPIINVIEHLIGKGYTVKIHDPVVQLGALVGTNRDFLMHQIPHISTLMADSVAEIIDESEVVVIATGHETFKDAFGMRREDQPILDFVQLIGDEAPGEGYVGICW
jgi:GDP-mannose 6-dehydrogenase